MTDRPKEETRVHTRLLNSGLLVEESRAYWTHRLTTANDALVQTAFDNYWFGAKSMPRIRLLITNLRARFDTFPDALTVLHRWTNMRAQTRTLICHFHLQLADPMYRAFAGQMLPAWIDSGRGDIRRDHVVDWVADIGPGRWTTRTRIQLASKLLSCAYIVGLVTKNRDPRPLATPTVTDEALAYILYSLRLVDFDGTLLANPYLASIGLTERHLDDRLRRLPGLGFRRMGDLADFDWDYPRLDAWAEATL